VHAGQNDEVRELPVQDRGAGLEHPQLVQLDLDPAPPQAQRIGRAEKREGADAVAGGPADVAHLFEAHLLSEVAEHHREARGAALGGRELLYEGDLFP